MAKKRKKVLLESSEKKRWRQLADMKPLVESDDKEPMEEADEKMEEGCDPKKMEEGAPPDNYPFDKKKGMHEEAPMDDMPEEEMPMDDMPAEEPPMDMPAEEPPMEGGGDMEAAVREVLAALSDAVSERFGVSMDVEGEDMPAEEPPMDMPAEEPPMDMPEEEPMDDMPDEEGMDEEVQNMMREMDELKESFARTMCRAKRRVSKK